MVALGQVAGSLPFSASKYVNGIFSFADSLNQEIYPTEGMKAVLLKIKQAVGLSIRWMKTSCLWQFAVLPSKLARGKFQDSSVPSTKQFFTSTGYTIHFHTVAAVPYMTLNEWYHSLKPKIYFSVFNNSSLSV